MRQNHIAGEKLFIDYAGQTVPIHLRGGEIKKAQIFVATLGASNYTYCEATWSQKSPDFIASHVRTFQFLGGVPQVLIPDNLKSAVSTPCIYEAEANSTYGEMARHYGISIFPARSRRPKDKSKVETAVLIVERWILARLRNERFGSLLELNQSISKLLLVMNQKEFKKIKGSREVLFRQLDFPALSPLPVTKYEFSDWKKVKVNIDYHVEIEKHYYSVHYSLVGKYLMARYTENTVELFEGKKRVASHLRSFYESRHTTLEEHMPKSHQEQVKWNPSRLLDWATKIGDSTHSVIHHLLHSRKFHEQAYRSCLGLLRLSKVYNSKRLDTSCSIAIEHGQFSYRYVRTILEKGQDLIFSNNKFQENSKSIEHENIRGNQYYQ